MTFDTTSPTASGLSEPSALRYGPLPRNTSTFVAATRYSPPVRVNARSPVRLAALATASVIPVPVNWRNGEPTAGRPRST